MATKKTTKKPAPKARRKTETVVCPHCGECFDVTGNGLYVCPECEEYVEVSYFGVPAVSQHSGGYDPIACGFATTKWLLKSFGALDVSDEELRKELNTDAESGIRASLMALLGKLGVSFDADAFKGTLPVPVFAALDKRGIVLKNPIRLELFHQYEEYLSDTFDGGGYAAILAWNGFTLHWMGVERRKGSVRVMDPWCGKYRTFEDVSSEWNNFLVFGFVRR